MNNTLGLGQDDDDRFTFSAYFRDMEPSMIALTACSVGVILGALIVGIADRTRCWVKLKRGYRRAPPPPPGYGDPPSTPAFGLKSVASSAVELSVDIKSAASQPPPPPPP